MDFIVRLRSLIILSLSLVLFDGSGRRCGLSCEGPVRPERSVWSFLMRLEIISMRSKGKRRRPTWS